MLIVTILVGLLMVTNHMPLCFQHLEMMSLPQASSSAVGSHRSLRVTRSASNQAGQAVQATPAPQGGQSNVCSISRGDHRTNNSRNIRTARGVQRMRVN
jgi:hypothetical protein